jgi:hypothetical protein
MKKLLFLSLLAAFVFTSKIADAQLFGISVSPQTQCYNPSGNNITASVAVGAPSATSYSWAVYGGSGTISCVPTMSITMPNGTTMMASLYCCGTYDIICSAYNTTLTPGSPLLISSVTSTISVICAPSITVTSSGSCSSGAYTLSASGASTYTWSNGSTGSTILVTPSVAACYTVIGTTSQGCTATKTVCVGGGSSPVISVTSLSGNTVCSGSYATLVAAGASSYTWQPGNYTGATIMVGPYFNTCYTVTGSNSSGCTGTAVKCITVVPTPTFGVIGNQFICQGQTAYLSLYGNTANNYTWYPGGFIGDSISVTPSVTTCYSVIASNNSGCNTSTGVCVYVQSASLGVSGNSVICSGSTTTLTATGATSYTWQPGNMTGASIIVSPSVTTCYTVIGNNTSGCSGTAVKCVIVNPKPSISTSGGFFCSGNQGLLTASGASTYTWLPFNMNGSNIVITPSVSMCYTVTGTGTNGCTNTASSCFSVIPTPVITISGNSGPVCAGTSVILSASGANSYTWIPAGSASASIVVSPSVSTCYTVFGYNFGCTGSAISCVTVQPGSLVISGNTSICAGSSTTLSVSGGSGVYTWYPGNLSGSSIVVSPSVSTCYSVVSSGSVSSCSGAGVVCVTVNQNPNIYTASGSFCAGQPGTISAFGAATYTWQPFNLNGSSVVISPSVTGCYTVAGTSSNGCISSTYGCYSVFPSPNITISGNNSTCAGSSLILSASGASTYTWLPVGMISPSVMVTPTASTCYTVIGNNFGCTGSAVKCVSVQPNSLVITGNTNICSGSSTTLTVNGGSGVYTWYPGNITGSSIVVSPSVSTCYSVVSSGTVSSCANSGGVCVTVNAKPAIYTASGSFCAGQSGTVSAFGASTYTWLPFNMNGANIVISPSVTGCYTVMGTGSNGCINSTYGCYSVFPVPTIIVSGNNASCSSNSITLVASGASSYTWMPGGMTSASVVVNPLTNTCYTVTGSNFFCTSTAVKCVSVQAAPVISVTGNLNVCSGSSTTLVASGASTYTWLPGNATGNYIVLTPTANTCYTLVGTNSGGCVGVTAFCVLVKAKPIITVNSPGAICAGSTATLIANGGTSYSWQPYNITGSSIVVSTSVGTCYTVTGVDSSGCSNKATNCFSVMPSPSVNISSSNSVCAGGSIFMLAGGATSYTWLPGGMTSPSIVVNPSASTCYTLLGSSGGCIGKTVKCISVAPGLFISISGNNIICSGQSANLLASGAATYTWNTGSNSQVITVSPSASTCYSVIGTSSQGCMGSAVKCISVQPVPVLTVSGNSPICFGKTSILHVTGATSYQWNTGSTSSSIAVSPLSSTAYSVTGTNGACSSTTAIYITVLPKPIVTALSSSSVICAGTQAILFATGGVTYTWSNGASSPSIIVSPSLTTTYLVKATGTNGCDSSATVVQVVSACTGISQNIDLGETIRIYPNPSSGLLTIESGTSLPIDYIIYDVSGRKIMHGTLNGSQTINVSDVANGTYFVRFESADVVLQKKLIIQK